MKANPDIQITVSGETYTLRFSAKALAALQDHWGALHLGEVGQRLAALEDGIASIDDCVAICWAGLRTHHPDVSKSDALDMLDDMGMDSFLGALGDALGASSGEGGGDAPANPPRGQSTRSSNSAAKSKSRRP